MILALIYLFLLYGREYCKIEFELMIIKSLDLVFELLELNLIFLKTLNLDLLDIKLASLASIVVYYILVVHSHIELQPTLLKLSNILRILLFELRENFFLNIFNSLQLIFVKINSNEIWNYAFNFVANNFPPRILRVSHRVILVFKFPICYGNLIFLFNVE